MAFVVGAPESPPENPPLFEAVVEALTGPGWCVIPDFLPDETWRALAAEARDTYEDGGFRHAGVGRGENFSIRPEIRNDRVRWIDPLEPTALQQAWLDRVESLRLAINRELMLGLFGFEGHFALYPEGSFYKRHFDRFTDAANRTVTLVQYLNEDWKPEDGGALRIYQQSESGAEFYSDVLPHGGSAVLFLTEKFAHEVLPANRERLSLTGWYFRRR